MNLLLAVLLRAAVLVGVTLAYLAVLDNSDSTDALGAGLLAFLIMTTIAFVWALADGVRHGFGVALARWLVTSAVAGVGLPAAAALVNDADTDGFAGTAVFFALLLAVPALTGLVIGAIVHRVMARDEAPAAG